MPLQKITNWTVPVKYRSLRIPTEFLLNSLDGQQCGTCSHKREKNSWYQCKFARLCELMFRWSCYLTKLKKGTSDSRRNERIRSVRRLSSTHEYGNWDWKQKWNKYDNFALHLCIILLMKHASSHVSDIFYLIRNALRYRGHFETTDSKRTKTVFA